MRDLVYSANLEGTNVIEQSFIPGLPGALFGAVPMIITYDSRTEDDGRKDIDFSEYYNITNQVSNKEGVETLDFSEYYRRVA